MDVFNRRGTQPAGVDRRPNAVVIPARALRSDSDVDVLVEFETDRIPGLLGMARLERELSPIFGGRKVDLRTPEDLSRYFRQSIVEEAEVQHARG